jgi:hypothetical protein
LSSKNNLSFFPGLISSFILFVAFVPSCDDDKGTGNLETPRYGVRELAPAFGAAGCGSPCESGGKPPHSIPRLPPFDGFTVPSTTDEFLIA